MASTSTGSVDIVNRLVSEIFTAPDIEEILLTDPRFRWVVRRLYTGGEGITTLRDLVDAAVADMSVDNDLLEEALGHLHEFLQEQAGLTLEDELFSIVAPLTRGHGRVQAMLDRFGWAGTPPTTLQEAAETLGITRERVRQIQGSIERELLRNKVWAPVLHRAVRIVRSELPVSERDMGTRLKRAGIATNSTFSAEGLIKAADLFEPTASLGLMTRHGSTWIIDPAVDDQMLLITDIRTAVQKSVTNQGLVSIDAAHSAFKEACADETARECTVQRFRQIVEELEGYAVIGGAWIVHRNLDIRNPLVNRLNKILAICPAVSVDWAVYLLRREYRENRALDIDAGALRAFVEYRPEYRLADDTLSADSPVHPADALSDSEQTLRRYILANGGSATFRELELAGERAGLQKITVAVTLRSSPIFIKPDYNTYRTIGTGASMALTSPPEPLVEDDEADAAIEQAELAPTDVIFEETDSPDLEPLTEPDSGAKAPVPLITAEGIAVDDRDAGRVRRLIKQFLKREGVVGIDAVLRQYASQYLPVSRAVIMTVAHATPDFVVIRDDLITSIRRDGSNPLASGLRKMLTVLPALPVDLAIKQFLRDSRVVTQITPDGLEAYVTVDDEFGLDGSVIVWERPDLVSNVLTSEEKVIVQLLRNLPEPIGLGTVRERLRLSRYQEAQFDEVFLSSVLVEEVGKGRYRLLGAEYREAIARSQVEQVAAGKVTSEPVIGTEATAVSAVKRTSQDSDSTEAEVDATTPPDLESEKMEFAADLATRAEAPVADVLPSQYGTTETTMITLRDLVERARDGRLRLPEIQREYVWKPTQVRGLLDSLYRNYPIGNMLIWQTPDRLVSRRIGGSPSGEWSNGGSVSFLLDGQQRLTSLQRLLDTNEPDIRFNPFTEEFRAATTTVRRNRQWIPVHTVLTRSVGAALREHGLDRHDDVEELERRLERLKGILSIQVPVNRLHNFDYEAVTDIFVRVNSQGTRLRTAELAVANLAFQLPGIVSEQLSGLRDELAIEGWDIDTLVLMRMLNAIVTGQSSFRRLASVHTSEIEGGWPKLATGIRGTLRLIREQLGISSIDWLPTINALVVPVTYIAKAGEDRIDMPGLIDWFVRASVFGRYTGPTETRMNQDLRAIATSSNPFQQMNTALRGTVGNFRITLADVQGASWQSPLTLLFWLTLRRTGASDIWTGTALRTTQLEGRHDLVRHQLISRRTVGFSLPATQHNELSNFALLTQEPDPALQEAPLANALADVPVDRLESQLIPADPDLWQPANARRFIEHRRRLLVRGMNETLQALADG